MYLGKDIIGSIRSATTDTGALKDRYEYDAFGQPYKGDLSGDMNLGYTGKPYDTATGLYNYGYRDYKPQAARFTTVDPIRDGRNWYAYVNNDPVNWVDLWGLEWKQTGKFNENYTKVREANEERHLGNDWAYVDKDGNNKTKGKPVYALTSGEAKVGYRSDIGNYIRVTSDDDLRTDYFHLDSILIKDGSQIRKGDIIGTAGDSGGVKPHLHTAQSYPEGKAPPGVDVINKHGRSYIAPQSDNPGKRGPKGRVNKKDC